MVSRLRNGGLLVLLLVLPALLAGQEEPPPDVWKPLRVLVGSWEGTGTGRWGEAIGHSNTLSPLPLWGWTFAGRSPYNI